MMWGLGLVGEFSSNNNLSLCILLFYSPLLNGTSPPLFFWRIDQNKKSSFKEWQLPHSWMTVCCWDSALARAASLLLGCCAFFGLHSFHLHGLGGKAGLGNGGWAHVLKEVTVCCFAVLHLVKVVTPQVPTFQPIAIHLLLPHPLPLVHQPLGAASGNLPLLALHQSVQTLLHLCSPPGKASWSHLSWLSQLMLLKTHVRFEAKRLCQCRSKFQFLWQYPEFNEELLFWLTSRSTVAYWLTLDPRLCLDIQGSA